MIREQGRGDGGCIEVISGGMFSGKSEELLRRLRRALIARQRVQVFRIATDTRGGEADVLRTRDNRSLSAETVASSAEMREKLMLGVEVVGIDEAQFFDEGLVDLVTELADLGVRVIVAGLDLDFRRRPFGPIPELMAIAEYVDKMHAVCVRCGPRRSTRCGSPAATSRCWSGMWRPTRPVAGVASTRRARRTKSVPASSRLSGVRTTPHVGCATIEPSPEAGYLLIGSDDWLGFDCKSTGETLSRAFEIGCPIGVVCAATVFAARIGLFEDREHTSNGFESLREHAGDYPGSQHYVSSSSAVSHRNLVTASGLAALTFSREYLKLVKGDTPFDEERYFAVYSKER